MSEAPHESEVEPIERIRIKPGEDGTVNIITSTTEIFPSAVNAITSLRDRARMLKTVIYPFGLAGLGSGVWGVLKEADVLFKFTEPSAEKIVTGAGLIVLGMAFLGIAQFVNERKSLAGRKLDALAASIVINPSQVPEESRALQL